MIYAGRSWHAPAQHTGPSTTSTVRCPSSFPAPEGRVVYTNSGMDLAAAVACRRHSRSEYAMTTEIRAMMRACWTSRMPRTPLPVSLCEFVALAGELGLAWPQGQRPHPVIGFSEVTLTEQTLADYADTLAYLGRPSGCTATPSAAWGCSAAKAKRRARLVRMATASSRPARPASGSRSPAAASRPGRSG